MSRGRRQTSLPILPERLRAGDTAALVAPASAPPNPRAIDHAAAELEAVGFRVKLGRHVRKRRGYLAGTDRERADDLMRMFADSAVKAILCVRGGYGTARLLPRLDYGLIRKHPKILVGYSDITALHCALLVKAGLLSFHGPMPASDFIKPDFPPFARAGWMRTLMEPHAAGPICRDYPAKTVSILHRGTATGPLIGGNLSVLCTMLGTPYQPPFRERILFLEDLDEPPYRIDRMLTHLLNAGVLQQVAGIAIGNCAGCAERNTEKPRTPTQSLDDVLKERLLPLKVPVVAGLPFGHVPHNATLPVGGQVSLDANRGDLVILRASVK